MLVAEQAQVTVSVPKEGVSVTEPPLKLECTLLPPSVAVNPQLALMAIVDT